MRSSVVVGLVLLVACGDSGNAKQDAGMDGPVLLCGNGVVDENESCDDGDANGGPDARCTTMCQWICFDDNYCTDNDPCNGAETCSEHRCYPGTGVADGTDCGTGKLCRNEACTDAACGDGFVTAPGEECDDANSNAGDGCENDCTFSCVSTDSLRNCTPADACAGQGTCDDQTHVCAAGTQLPNNDPCNAGAGYCKNGTCTTPMCGNGMVEPGEICDLGAAANGTAGSGCKSDCTYQCVTASTDCPAAPACQMPSCNQAHACANVANNALDGMSCGSGLICANGACTTPTAVCGNGVTETGEECDYGAGNNTAGSGCEPNCQYSCDMVAGACTDGNACNGTESCTGVTVNTHAGQKCTSTAPLTNGTACGTDLVCKNQLCVTSVCGDSLIDPLHNETCDPPSATCDAQCHTIVCGDGVRAGTEQCDDGNMNNIDGCDGTCKFEQCHRVNKLSLAFNTDTYCTANRLGSGIVGGTARTQLNTALTDGVADGSITIELKAINLDDLSGTSDPTLSLGVLSGTPVTPGSVAYNGASDLDWWYTTSASVLNPQRVPLTTVPGAIAAKTLTTTATDITISISLGGVPATLDMLQAKVTANIISVSTPLSATGAVPPGHLAAEHLDPMLTSFDKATGGKLCGNVTAQSLANVAIPDALVGCGGLFAPCTQCYTATHTMLDVVVNGCTQVLLGTQIAKTQPDGARAGSGGTYTLTEDATTHKVTACKKGMASAPIAECLANATYSSFLQFETDRVIAK